MRSISGGGRVDYRIDDAVAFAHHLPVPKADDAIAAGIQIRSSHRIVGYGGIAAVLSAIQFDNQFGAVTTKIDDVSIERHLAAKVKTDCLKRT